MGLIWHDGRVQRRSFLIGSASGGVLLACKPWTHPTARPEQPTGHELATLAAIADTFVPGGDGSPGANEANAVATIVDPAYGLAPYISEVVSDLDEWCLVRYHHPFVDLAADQRELALEERMGLRGKVLRSWYAAAYEGMLALTKLAFFGGLTSTLGTNWLAFPGASRGYAPESAAGAWASSEPPREAVRGAASQIVIDGAGQLAAARASVYATSDDDAQLAVRLTTPDGRTHDARGRAVADGVIRIELAPSPGGPAAGAWRLAVTDVIGAAQLELWSLVLRTDLDDAA